MRKLLFGICLVVLACGTSENVVKTVGVSGFDVSGSSKVLFLMSPVDNSAFLVFPTKCLSSANCATGVSQCRNKNCGYDETSKPNFVLSGKDTGGNSVIDMSGTVVIYACFLDANGSVTGSGKATVADSTALDITVKTAAEDSSCALALANIPEAQ